MTRLQAKSLFSHPILILATGFGSGLLPKFPGTFGTLVALPLYLMICTFDNMVYWIIIVMLFLVGILICNKAIELMGEHDHPSIVWDEIVGFLITMYSLPLNWVMIIAGFVLFRILDIVKPWPISFIDKSVKGGIGVMLDDVIAGVTANIILQVFLIVMAYNGYILR